MPRKPQDKNLTPEEKRLRTMETNRISARKSAEKKKMYISKIENENKVMKEQLNILFGIAMTMKNKLVEMGDTTSFEIPQIPVDFTPNISKHPPILPCIEENTLESNKMQKVTEKLDLQNIEPTSKDLSDSSSSSVDLHSPTQIFDIHKNHRNSIFQSHSSDNFKFSAI